jgi:hypothetical protein
MPEDGLKSAYELAMERLEAKGGAHKPLTDEQKKAIAEAEQKGKAQIAEIEIMVQQEVAKAAGDPEKLKEVEDRKQQDIAKVREKTEEAKEQIRQG